MVLISADELQDLCERSAVMAGADTASAHALAAATVESERFGKGVVGVSHLFDYLDGYRSGRIASGVEAKVSRPSPVIFDVDACHGLAQSAFAAVRDDLICAVREFGLAALWIRDSYTCGELGGYPRYVAGEGLVGIAMANSPALMSVGGSTGPVLGTNPLAYAVPRPSGSPIVVDQASSATAFVNIRRSAQAGEKLPEGQAIDSRGAPTVSAEEALGGALLAFGGHRGGNIALLVEILATLSGGRFSSDAAPFDSGEESPGIGVFLLCLDPARFEGSVERLAHQLRVLEEGHGVDLPYLRLRPRGEEIELDDDLLLRLRASASQANSND